MRYQWILHHVLVGELVCYKLGDRGFRQKVDAAAPAGINNPTLNLIPFRTVGIPHYTVV